MSEIRATTISDAAGTGPITLTKQSAAKAWINFDGDNISIRDSLNAASIVDEGTGVTRINFSNAMANDDYAIQSHDHSYGNGWSDSLTTTSYKTRRRNESAGYVDVTQIWGLIHGDLA